MSERLERDGLRLTLRRVCEDGFADECPKNGHCDTYGHDEQCGAVSISQENKNLRAERDGLRAALESVQAFIDYEVRAWLSEYTHHTECGLSGCPHGRHERGMFEMLDSYVDKCAALGRPVNNDPTRGV